MSLIDVLGICASLSVFIFLIIHFIGATMLIVIFPAIFAGNITGERGLFSPNGNGGPSSVLFNFLMVFFILLEVAIVASLFLGIYVFLGGIPQDYDLQKVNILTASQVSNWMFFTKILAVAEIFFLGMFIYNSFKNKDSIKNLKGIAYFQYRILPILSFPLGFIMFYGGYQYLSQYPTFEIHLLTKIAAYLYILYLMYSLGKSIYVITIIFKTNISQQKPTYWLMFVKGFVYNISCFYYFFSIDFMF